MYKEMKCKKCRKAILNESEVKQFVDAHNSKFDSDPEECDSIRNGTNVYLTTYKLPAWLLDQIDAENWTKGKIHCPHCQNKIGTFDHIGGQKCSCAKYELAPISFVKSKIDLIKNGTSL
ncbi:unnamed protein product [Phyllotreta striolata]|uniref:Uncharacterized protein n=1 Tax=Phyllotreta striolata TaxID=444603 RepID=A0A9N9U0F9_PHYSR|nr:unnamed protein product [Phyllotreta striolata]